MLLINIYDSNPSPSKNLIWQTEFKGKKADKELQYFKSITSNVASIGNTYTLKFNDGEGGGFKGTGSLMQIDLNEIENQTVADLHFDFEKWHSY